MQDQDLIVATLEKCAARREDRRNFMRSAAMAAGVTFLAACDNGGGPDPVPPVVVPPVVVVPPPAGITDADILNFALNLEYLEAEFYSAAATGAPLPANLVTGTGAQGVVTGGRQVTFTDPLVGQYAREIAMDERQHVIFLRTQLGASAVARPNVDIGADPMGAFSSAARAAGLITGANERFDPYSSDENFLLAAFIFEDVGVTAFKGAAPLITSKTFVEAAAGILAAEAYHAGLIRTVLYGKGLQVPALRTATEQISNARDSLDGPSDLDQGVAPQAMSTVSNIVPTDANGLAFSRSGGQALNIVYLTRMATDRGGFFPTGVNGTIRQSAAN